MTRLPNGMMIGSAYGLVAGGHGGRLLGCGCGGTCDRCRPLTPAQLARLAALQASLDDTLGRVKAMVTCRRLDALEANLDAARGMLRRLVR
jgi:hypothetical protein